MRLIAIVLFVFISIAARSQTYYINEETGVAVGMSGGYSSKQCAIGNMSVGTVIRGGNHVSANLVVLSKLNNVNIPGIFEARLGHFFNSLEIYGGAGYHIAGTDNKVVSNPNTGVRAAYGVVKHFYESPWTISAGMSGKIFSVQLGVFFIR